MTPGNLPPGIQALPEDLPFGPDPSPFDTGSLGLVALGSSLLCSLDESCLYSPGSLLPFPWGPYSLEYALIPSPGNPTP